MTVNQKLETSREVRLWVGIGIKLTGLGIMAYYYIPGFRHRVNDRILDYKAKHHK